MLPDGAKLADASGEDQKSLWRERLLTLKVFRRVKSMLAVRKTMSKKVLAKALHVWLPSEEPEQLFATFIGWARFGDSLRVRRGHRDALAVDDPRFVVRPVVTLSVGRETWT